MFIVLHCGGIPFNGETIREKSLGGSESAAYYLAKHLAERGHRVSIFTKDEKEGVFDGVRYLFMGEQNEQYPMGERYHFYCANTPHDVNIAQRHPLAFQNKFASKINLLWLHDIGLVRNAQAINSTMWQVDGVLVVSKFHKKQIIDTWKLEKGIVIPITNGVDGSMYRDFDVPGEDKLKEDIGFDQEGLTLLYQSRPERGLEELVKPDGIMERLLTKRPDAKLYVCGYEHDVPAMKQFYDGLYARVEELPNCVNLGHLPKDTLARIQKSCDFLIYPTEFEEVSCITAMEAMHAGLPMIASKTAALPETCKGAGAKLIKNKKSGGINTAVFVDVIAKADVNSVEYKTLVEKQLAAAKKFTWEVTADQVEDIISKVFKKVQNPATVLKDLIRCSDIIAAEKYLTDNAPWPDNPITNLCVEELKLYDFANDEESYDEHYQEGTNAFYDGDFQKVGRENVAGSARFECISGRIGDLSASSFVIDYGCAHGHYTIELAKRFPKLQFLGIDISERAIQEAEQWAKDDKVTNVDWFVGTAESYVENNEEWEGVPGDIPLADAIIAAEVLEHVRSPRSLVSQLSSLLKAGGQFIITTPYGPWEEMSYRKDHPTRFHLHHYERADLHDMFGHHEDFNIVACPSGTNPAGDVVGQYVTVFKLGDLECVCAPIDYERKFKTLYPRQTVSLCMIAKDSAQTIGKSLLSVGDYVDEILIGVDTTTADKTERAVQQFVDERPLWPIVRTFPIESPMETGFDEARNTTLEDATSDWIMWFDTDEEVIVPESLPKLLRHNEYLGYPLPQTHFSINPLQVLNTDYPVRLFRNNSGIKFFGVVHEHPELKLNKGIGAAWIQQAPIFSHNGYMTEEIRRKRFDRNFPLMKRDRAKYPTRILGKFLWIRDVAHACQFHLEENHGMVIPEMHEAAGEAIKIWEELLKTDQIRMIEDSMQYYSLLCEVLGSDLSFGIRLGANKLNGGVNLLTEKETNCKFLSLDHIKKFVTKIVNEKVKGYETRYF